MVNVKHFFSVLALSLLMGCTVSSHRNREQTNQPSDKQNYQVVTGDDTGSSRNQWDKFFDTPNYVFGRDPIPFLKDNIEKIRVGRALVLAMGEGRNAVFLARHGFKVDGIDISEVALRKARRLAKEYNVDVNTITGSIRDYQIEESAYDFIMNVEYFRESIIPGVKKGLKKGGVVLFQNYLKDHVKNPTGMSVPQNFLVEPGELKTLFHDFEILYYKEFNDGKESIAQLLARKT